jgi:hypothetical protein
MLAGGGAGLGADAVSRLPAFLLLLQTGLSMRVAQAGGDQAAEQQRLRHPHAQAGLEQEQEGRQAAHRATGSARSGSAWASGAAARAPRPIAGPGRCSMPGSAVTRPQNSSVCATRMLRPVWSRSRKAGRRLTASSAFCIRSCSPARTRSRPRRSRASPPSRRRACWWSCATRMLRPVWSRSRKAGRRLTASAPRPAPPPARVRLGRAERRPARRGL